MKGNTIYLSDILSVPMPKHAESHEAYLRKVQYRRIIWALLPYVVRGLVTAACVVLIMSGLTVMMLGLGG